MCYRFLESGTFLLAEQYVVADKHVCHITPGVSKLFLYEQSLKSYFEANLQISVFASRMKD